MRYDFIYSLRKFLYSKEVIPIPLAPIHHLPAQPRDVNNALRDEVAPALPLNLLLRSSALPNLPIRACLTLRAHSPLPEPRPKLLGVDILIPIVRPPWHDPHERCFSDDLGRDERQRVPRDRRPDQPSAEREVLGTVLQEGRGVRDVLEGFEEGKNCVLLLLWLGVEGFD